MTLIQRKTLELLTIAILETIQQAGPHGVIAGHLYNALNSQGISITLFQAIMAGLVDAGKIKHSNNQYFANTGSRPCV